MKQNAAHKYATRGSRYIRGYVFEFDFSESHFPHRLQVFIRRGDGYGPALSMVLSVVECRFENANLSLPRNPSATINLPPSFRSLFASRKKIALP